MDETALHESSRSAALRRPQSGTSTTNSQREGEGLELVGDAELMYLGLKSAKAAALCGVLLRTQIQTYLHQRHIISFADEYAMRRIKNACVTGRLPNMYVRCMRCGCIALLLDWAVAVYAMPGMVDRPGATPPSPRQVVSREFMDLCTGTDKVKNSHLWPDLREEESY